MLGMGAHFVQCDKDVAGMEGGGGIIKELGAWYG
jgi:hypothetical protein